MDCSDWDEKELEGVGQNKSNSKTSLASVESLSMPLVQEIVLSADIRCTDCQERVADIMSRMMETYTVLVSVLEKKVTLTCRYSGAGVGARQVSKISKRPLSKISMIKKLLSRSPRS